jgi:hypothetical protein
MHEATPQVKDNQATNGNGNGQTNSHAMTPYTSHLPSTEVGGFGIEGLEDMGRRDIVLPRKTIVQLTSKKSEQYGGFFDNLTQQATKTIDAVILQIKHDRTLWSGDPGQEGPECKSVDGITGSQYGACANCQFNTDNNADLWNKGMKRCSLGYMLLAVDEADGTMFIFSASKTSAKPVKPLISQFVNRRKPPFAFVSRFENVKVTNDANTYYVFKPSIVRELSATELAQYRDLYQSMKGATIKDIDEADDDSDGGPGFSDRPPDFDENGEPF